MSWNFQESLDFGLNNDIIDTFSLTMCYKSHANIRPAILCSNLSEFPIKRVTAVNYCMFSSELTFSFVRFQGSFH